MMKLAKVFDDYPNPMFIVKPIINSDGVSNDFSYVYANESFCIFIGRSYSELIGHNYSENFIQVGEKFWLDLFCASAIDKKHAYVNNVSIIIDTKLYVEVFHVDPNLCGCIIHDFQKLSEANEQHAQELRHRAVHDCLTGFYNRYYLEEQSSIIASHKNVGVTFVDINNLKTINDTLGHSAGDKLILQVCSMIRSLYEDSMVFRVGGDEFVIITISKDREQFLKMSERSNVVLTRDNLVAMGYNFYENVYDLQVCIDQCDLLMYENKKMMKNSQRTI